VVGTLSGPAGASLGSLADGVRVWSRFINDNGGINGHKVEVITGDDGGDPSRHRSLVQEFVEQRGVIAFVGNPEALTGAGSVDYLTGVGVPVIGSEGAGQWFYQSPVYFPQASTGNALAQSAPLVVAALAKPRGLTKVATINCVEVQVCRDSTAKAQALYGKVGLEVVYQAQSSLGQPDFTAECLNAKGKGAQIVAIGMDANAIRSIAQACARQGFRPLFVWTAGSVSSAQASDPNLDGALIASNVAPWPSTTSALTKEFNDAMTKYAPGTGVTGGHMQGWVAAKVFQLATQQLPEPPTAKAVLDGLDQLNGDVLPDLTGPLLFAPGVPATPSVCGFAVFIQGGKFAAGDIGRVCADYDPSL
jgi:branched-chain amino acid transport system substrate-binding protein